MAPGRRPSPAATETDHDLLIRIDTRLDVLHSSVRENNAALNSRLDSVVREKANLTDLDPLRTAIASVQRDVGEQCEDITKKVDKTDFDKVNDKLDSTRRIVFIGIGIVLAAEAFLGYLIAK